MAQIEVNQESSTPEELKMWVNNSVQPNTGKVYLRNWKGFYDWLQVSGPMSLRGMTPGDLVKKQKSLNRAYVLDEIMLPEKKMILYAVLEYVNHGDNATWRSKYKKKIQSSVRSFFVYFLGTEGFPALNGGEKNRLKGSPKTRKELTIKTVKAIIDNSNAMYKAVWSSMLASGMGIGEVIKFSEQGIDVMTAALADPIRIDGEELIEIRFQARKHNIENDFYVYVGGSALDYLKTYMTHREDMEARFNSSEMREERARYYRKVGREAPPLPAKFPEAIFINNTYKPLTRSAAQFYWISQLKQLKIWKSNGRRTDRTNMNIHQIRSVFRTRWTKVALPRDYSAEAQKAIGEYFMGHNIDPLDYNQIENDEEYRIKAYMAALPWLDVNKLNIERQSEATNILQAKIEGLEAKLDTERRNKIEKDMEFRDLVEDVKDMKAWRSRIYEKEKELDRLSGRRSWPTSQDGEESELVQDEV